MRSLSPSLPLAALCLLLAPASSVAQEQWKLTFEDNFDPGFGECYAPSKLYCRYSPGLIQPCAEAYHDGLKDLNRCNWVLYRQYNFWPHEMHGDSSNGFDPSQVEVRDGILHLHSTLTGYSKATCNPGRHCPILSGALDTLGQFGTQTFSQTGFPANTGPTGFQQLYGKFEVRLRVHADNRGSWPAAWTLGAQPQMITGVNHVSPWPADLKGWPYDGEMDLMEYWGSSPTRVQQTFHSDANDLWKRINISVEDFHVYGMEWNPDSVRFYIDGELTSEITSWDRRIPSVPEYWILSLSMLGDQIAGKGETEMEVDWVKTWRRCGNGEAGCDTLPKVEPRNVSVQTFPNPARSGGEVTLEVRTNQECRRGAFSVVSADGSTVRQFANLALHPQDAQHVVLNSRVQLPYVPAGIYFLRADLLECGPARNQIRDRGAKILIQP